MGGSFRTNARFDSTFAQRSTSVEPANGPAGRGSRESGNSSRRGAPGGSGTASSNRAWTGVESRAVSDRGGSCQDRASG
ncbi:MAG: hypothetical protein CL931_08165 [Deltaproteobacteria bacterium]|nr:hypothetical protein [Deltaproteobacteria bacterium]